MDFYDCDGTNHPECLNSGDSYHCEKCVRNKDILDYYVPTCEQTDDAEQERQARQDG
jgi:adenosyl cobinamide kinase/adenosyl cobinamide phosphate guanylyltransferase